MLRTGKKFSKPSLSRAINGDLVLVQKAKKQKRARLDLALVKQYPEYNRSTLQAFIKNGYVSIDNIPVYKPNTPISDRSIITLNLPLELTDENIKQAMANSVKPDIIYEDQDIIVFNKTAGLLSMHKNQHCFEPTLEDYGLLVHRLDRDTSGIVILAKNETTQKELKQQFQDRKTHKTYYAIVEGCPKLTEATIDLPIARNIKHPTTFIVEAGGKPSETYYRVLKTKKFTNSDIINLRKNISQNSNFSGTEFREGKTYSLLELKPTTGRTHQLRVHLKYLGTPIVGDRVYGSTKPDSTDRLYLHAESLEINTPNHDHHLFDSELPAEFNIF